MSYDIHDYSGYIINVKSFLKGFPDILKGILDKYPSADAEYPKGWYGIDSTSIHMDIFDVMQRNGLQGLDYNITGSWYGDVIRYNPFLPREVYISFDEDYLFDEVRKNGCSIKKESALFRKLKRFMAKYQIPEDDLTFAEWQFGG